MDKVLVLSCGTGGGHNSAARAIVDRLNKDNCKAVFSEYLDIVNPKMTNIINKIYIKSTIGNGRIFKKVYKLGEIYDEMKLKSPVYALNKLSKKKLYDYIMENGYDYVVTTHLFAAQALTAIKKGKNIHFIAIATDYRCIPFWKETNPDYFIIPHKDLEHEFISKGIKKEKLIPFGIPVSENFNSTKNRKEILNELNLEDRKYLLVMSGSMGFGNVLKIVEALDDNISKEISIIITCGKNEKLYKELKSKYSENERIILLQFTNEVYKYMKISEIILTKPGGLTTTEAATANVPIIHTFPIPGCENYNASFFEDRKMSISCKNIGEIISYTKKLLNDENLRNSIVYNQKNNVNKEACKQICEFIIKEIHKEEKNEPTSI